MRSRFIVNLVLFAIVAGLAIFAYNSGQDDTVEQLSTLTTESINQIRIRHNQQHAKLVKNDSGWEITQPVSIAANQFRVGTILKLLSTPLRSSYEAEELELSKYGLDPATTEISFNDLNIHFGIAHPMNRLRYVKIENRVHLIDDQYYPLISSQLGTLVSRNLVPETASLARLELPELTISKDAQGQWQTSADISADHITELLQHWKRSQAFGVHNYYARESLGQIQVFLENTDAPIKFTITDVDPWLIIARPDLNLEYHFNLEFYDRLLRPGNTEEPLNDAPADGDSAVKNAL